MPDQPEGGAKDSRTRRERLEAQGRKEGAEPSPFLDAPRPFHPHLQPIVDHLFEVGPTSAGEVVGWREIEAWMRATASPIEPFEALLLRRLSVEFIAEREAAKAPGRPYPGPPPELSKAQAQSVSDARERYFDRLAASAAANAPPSKAIGNVQPRAKRKPPA